MPLSTVLHKLILKVKLINLTFFCCLLLLAGSCTNGKDKAKGWKSAENQSKIDAIAALLKRGDSMVNKPGEFAADLEQGIALATQARQLSNGINYEEGIGKSVLLLAKAYVEMKQVAKGLEYGRMAMEVFTKSGNKDDVAASLLLIGGTFSDSHKDFPEKIVYYEKAAALYHTSGNQLQEAETKQLIADLYGNDEQLNKSLEVMNEAMAIYKKIGYKRLQAPYNLLGSIYLALGKEEEGRRYLILAVKVAEELRDSSGFMATIYNRLGFAYSSTNDYNQSEAFFRKAYAIAIAAKDTSAIATLINNLADIMSRTGRYKESSEFLRQSYAKYRIEGNDLRVALTAVIFLRNDLALHALEDAKIRYNRLLRVDNLYGDDPGYLFVKAALVSYLQETHRYGETYPYLDAYKKGILYGKDFKRSARAELLYFVSDSALGRHPSAIQHYQLYKVFSDSITAVDRGKRMEELRFQYETEKKDKNIILLKSEQHARDTQLKWEKNIRFLIIGGALVLLLFFLLLYNRYRLKKQNNEQLELQKEAINQQNEVLKRLVEDKEWLLKEVHHRVKNNLQIAISLLNIQSEHLESEDARAAIRNSQRRIYAMSLIHQRLYQSDNLGNIDMAWYLAELTDFLKDSFDDSKMVGVFLDCDTVYLDVVQAVPLGLILNEAFSNCIKHAFTDGRKGKIYISLKKQDADYCLLSIVDNGVGFEPGSTSDDSLGMSLMQGLSVQVEGVFDIISEPKGVSIHIRFKSRSLAGTYLAED